MQGDPEEATAAIQAEEGAWPKAEPMQVVGFECEAGRYSDSLHAV